MREPIAERLDGVVRRVLLSQVPEGNMYLIAEATKYLCAFPTKENMRALERGVKASDDWMGIFPNYVAEAIFERPSVPALVTLYNSRSVWQWWGNADGHNPRPILNLKRMTALKALEAGFDAHPEIPEETRDVRRLIEYCTNVCTGKFRTAGLAALAASNHDEAITWMCGYVDGMKPHGFKYTAADMMVTALQHSDHPDAEASLRRALGRTQDEENYSLSVVGLETAVHAIERRRAGRQRGGTVAAAA
jgi:hypothetical protein